MYRQLNFTVLIIICVFGVNETNAGEPLDLIRTAYDRQMQLLRDPTLQTKDKDRELKERLAENFISLIDFDEKAKRIIGSRWAQVTPEEQRDFVAALKDYYKMRDYTPPRFTSTDLVLQNETINNQEAEVTGYFYLPAQRNAPVVYRLHLVNGEWKVYDSSGWGIEANANLHAQFARVMAKSSMRGLIDLLREKRNLLEKRRIEGS